MQVLIVYIKAECKLYAKNIFKKNKKSCKKHLTSIILYVIMSKLAVSDYQERIPLNGLIHVSHKPYRWT